jgi:hypothetical protein
MKEVTMANLKMTVEEACARLDKAGLDLHERLSADVEQLKTELRSTAEAIPRASVLIGAADIMERAAVAQSREIEIEYDRAVVNGSINLSSYGSVYMNDSGQYVAKGKYRALFFLIPVKE